VTGSGSNLVGLDNGATANKFTVMDREGHFLIDQLVELPSRVTEGPPAAIGTVANLAARMSRPVPTFEITSLA
jgi:hypothetical protein